jgi:hypothetical protein
MAVFIGATGRKFSKKTIIEFYTNKKWTFNEFDYLRSLPKSAKYFKDVWTIENGKNELYQIYRTNAGILYGYKKTIR